MEQKAFYSKPLSELSSVTAAATSHGLNTDRTRMYNLVLDSLTIYLARVHSVCEPANIYYIVIFYIKYVSSEPPDNLLKLLILFICLLRS